ncbi:hypothetical protein VTJ49DRAFT_4789 [Mycothermus thermophilus]|uniref:Uncharacterized protein n=1 Tax=Humicola insolens TaxID=85995 RepID=A0ABR3V4J7_HUMIN
MRTKPGRDGRSREKEMEGPWPIRATNRLLWLPGGSTGPNGRPGGIASTVAERSRPRTRPIGLRESPPSYVVSSLPLLSSPLFPSQALAATHQARVPDPTFTSLSCPPSTAPDAAYPPGELDVLLHNRDTLGVDGAQVGVFKEVDEEGLGGLLEGQNGLRLPPQLLGGGLELESDFSDLKEADLLALVCSWT